VGAVVDFRMNFLKKLATNKGEGSPSQANGSAPGGGNVQSMSSNLQRKFAKGCNYNMKVVIRGDRNTGKSALLARLQGRPFVEEYQATEEIQVASINWSYKNTEDIVKVEVWDVVDVAKKRVKIEGLKTSESGQELAPGLDAEFLDVYQGTHGVIMVMDITKAWTMDYIRKESEKVPAHIPILLLANFADQGHHRQVTQMQIADFVERFSRPGDEAAEIRWAECSLRNGFGLKLIHRFFNVPFLTLQRQSLLRQLEVNSRDIKATQEELDLYMESEEANYQIFSDSKTAMRRAIAEQVAPSPSSSIVAGQPSNTVEVRAPAAIPDISYSNKSNNNSTKLSTPTPTPVSITPAANNSRQPSPRKGPDTVDSFVPDLGDFDNFLSEDSSREAAAREERSLQDGEVSSDDEEGGNPMVARYDDMVDIGSYAGVNRSAAQDDSSDEDDDAKPVIKKLQDNSSDDENDAKPVIKKPQENLDDFLDDDFSAQPGDYEAL